MLQIIKIAFRNTMRQARRTVLLAGAIAFGMMIITLVNAFTAGLIDNIKENMSYAFGGHIYIAGTELTESGRPIGKIADGSIVDDMIGPSESSVQSIHRRSRAFATLIFGSKQATDRIDGVDFTVETDLAKGLPLRDGSLDTITTEEQPIILTGMTAQKLGVEVGETVLARLLTVTGQQNVGEFKVVAIIEDATSLGLSSSYASLPHLNSLIGLGPDQYQVVNLVLDDMRLIDATAEAIFNAGTNKGAFIERPLLNLGTDPMQGHEQGQEALGALFGQSFSGRVQEPWEGTKYQLTTLNEIMEPVKSVLSVLDAIALGIFVILLVITMVGITNTFRMILIERTREIGTMRAFGMQRRTVRSIFLWEAAIIAIGGGLLGLLLAVVVVAILSRISFAHIPGLQFFTANGYFAFHLTPTSFTVNMAILLGMSLLAAFLPANAAARLRPAKALGAHF